MPFYFIVIFPVLSKCVLMSHLLQQTGVCQGELGGGDRSEALVCPVLRAPVQ